MRLYLLAGWLLVAIAQAFAQSPTEAEFRSAEISLERTACYGSCPVYKVTIQGDGTVTYEGTEWVRVTGKQTAHVDPEAVQNLITHFLNDNFFALRDSYTSNCDEAQGGEEQTCWMVTDLPTQFLALQLGSRTKRVIDYFGAPDELRGLEREVDDLAGTRRWIFIDAAAIEERRKQGWNARSKEGARLLHDAVDWNDIPVARSLVAAGVDINDMSPFTAVWWAADRGSLEMLEYLISAGADVNLRQKDDEPAICVAAQRRDARFVEQILAAGVSVNEHDKYGETALMRAAGSGRVDVVRLLLLRGAEIDAKDSEGETAEKKAEAGLKFRKEYQPSPMEAGKASVAEYVEVISLLRSAGQK